MKNKTNEKLQAQIGRIIRCSIYYYIFTVFIKLQGWRKRHLSRTVI